MPRKGRYKRKEITPDSVYKDWYVAKLINVVMKNGKKGLAERAVYGAFEIVREKTKEDPLKVFHKALENIRPVLEVRSRRVGGVTYQVPMEVSDRRGDSLCVRWLVKGCNERKGGELKVRLANEILDAVNERGFAIKKRDDTHRMAEANKAFAHFRW
ncbi:MAG: 30S ribosomal protein S7 [Candidatus Dadabacteria bacterium]|nr:MAG: 30S ribosomal protein S7 [Candidatus Dadabacteria bacterium]